MKWLWSFNHKYRKKYHVVLEKLTDKEIHIFKNRRQLQKFLETI